VSHKNDPLCCVAKISITNGTFSDKFYTHMYSTKIHMLTILVFNFKVQYRLKIFIAKFETLVDKNVIILCILLCHAALWSVGSSVSGTVNQDA